MHVCGWVGGWRYLGYIRLWKYEEYICIYMLLYVCLCFFNQCSTYSDSNVESKHPLLRLRSVSHPHARLGSPRETQLSKNLTVFCKNVGSSNSFFCASKVLLIHIPQGYFPQLCLQETTLIVLDSQVWIPMISNDALFSILRIWCHRHIMIWSRNKVFLRSFFSAFDESVS